MLKRRLSFSDMKRNTMNLFEIHDYIETLEKRIERLERLIIDDEEEKEKLKSKPPFYYQRKPKEN